MLFRDFERAKVYYMAISFVRANPIQWTQTEKENQFIFV